MTSTLLSLSVHTDWKAKLTGMMVFQTVFYYSLEYRCTVKLAALESPRSCSLHHELHHSSDASLGSYGACSHLRAGSQEGQISCSLVMGTVRVTAIKQTTIPRLHLSSAVTSVCNTDAIKSESPGILEDNIPGRQNISPDVCVCI